MKNNQEDFMNILSDVENIYEKCKRLNQKIDKLDNKYKEYEPESTANKYNYLVIECLNIRQKRILIDLESSIKLLRYIKEKKWEIKDDIL